VRSPLLLVFLGFADLGLLFPPVLDTLRLLGSLRSPASFDEVHFGAFAGQYIRREYYFDVHPPLAKMLNALSGWLAGFNGDFGFDNIGDDYLVHDVRSFFSSLYEGMQSEGFDRSRMSP
jgi:dolichyl-phosphate-mannose--protein O-mannosyl transferase